jgi:hypothetical protein
MPFRLANYEINYKYEIVKNSKKLQLGRENQKIASRKSLKTISLRSFLPHFQQFHVKAEVRIQKAERAPL